MSTGSPPAAHVPVAPTVRHGWHKLLLGLFLLTRATRIPAAIDGMPGASQASPAGPAGPTGWWIVAWAVLALVLAAFAASEWEILRATSWRMRLPQWICLVLFHVGFTGFVVWIVSGAL
ncbi:hypothetical protein OG562_43155 [Streptomyces sp. NBC_01275]|uniref:hypothetical protein n=1 Tax=Streptomyces sp. NBC_01275 TaxID=2903807 RepID=UPI00225B88E9|nr:hypothetical protein [Streptomyces sp. NBC_01275]MCX4767639.1 hypothetical protein [Streptomyces sp. NBC_01275]